MTDGAPLFRPGPDVAKVRELLDRLALEVADLRRLAAVEPADLVSDSDRLKAVKYSFVVAIEVAVDVAHHLVSTLRLRAPRSYADAFAVLGEAGLLDDALVDRLAPMAGFRNLLVHGYARVDDSRVVTILQTRVSDLERFSVAMAVATLAEPDQQAQ